jgi:hypothetical protein
VILAPAVAAASIRSGVVLRDHQRVVVVVAEEEQRRHGAVAAHDLVRADALARESGDADAVVAFARNRAELDSVAAPAVEAARQDKLAWIACPKAGKLGTDLNRDVLAALLTARGVQPVRQVAIDETWSALRFRPA